MIYRIPYDLEVGGELWEIRTEYRIILDIIQRLQDEEEHPQVRVYVALSMFYVNFERMEQPLYQEAAEQMMWFIACGEEDDGRPGHKLIFWDHDANMIAADINKAAGREIRGPEPLHWWTFMGLFSAIGEGQLSTVVSIRDKLARGKKLDKWEQEFLARNKRKVIPKKKRTAEEQAEIDRLNALIDGR